MILQPTLLVLALLSSQTKPQVELHFPPKPEPFAPAANFADWHGWTYLHGASGVWPKIYGTSGDWTEIQARFGTLKPAKTAVWRLKVVIFTRVELDGKDSYGVERERRGTIESVQLANVQDALARFTAYVATKFDGAVGIEPSVKVEPEWMRDSGPQAFGPEFLRKYLEARINGGSYEAEDKIFRGPFNSVICVFPNDFGGAGADTSVNDTPVAAVPAAPIGGNGMTIDFDRALRQAWYRQVESRGKEQGFKAVSVGAPQAETGDPWTTLTNTGEVPAQTYLSRLATSLELHPAVVDPSDVSVAKLAPMDVQLAADPEKGQVLKVSEVSSLREGGFTLPARSDGMPIAKLDATPTLSFSAKTVTLDPMAIRLDSSNGKSAWVSVGSDPILIEPMPDAVVVGEPIVPDGKWHKIAFDAKALAAKAGLSDIVRMAIEPSPNAKLAGKIQADPVVYEFDEFKFSADPADAPEKPIVADALSDNAEARAMFAAQAKTASPALAALLNDKSEVVRLNATLAYIPLKDQSVEEALISNSVDLDPLVASAALAALLAEGSDKARAIVRRSVSVALSDYTKITAARLLAATPDAQAAERVSILSASHSWQAYVAAIDALAQIHTPDSQMWRSQFIGMADPAVKLAWTRNADPVDEKVVSALLWSAVNEPSDMVRAESYIKLILAPGEANKAEGYKGVRDDSRYVRKLVVDYLAAHPSEDHRNALRIAIADKSSEVRAAALLGFAALDKGASADEIASVLDDPNSDVQLALIDLSKKRSMKLPQKTIDAMLASPDPRVAAAARSLSASA